MLAGRCFCGAVRYSVADEFVYAMNCHCSNCRAATGSAFKPFGGIQREKLEVTDGDDVLLVHGDDDSNDTLTFQRNRVRHVVLPALQAAYPDRSPVRTLAALARRMAETDKFLSALAREKL